MRPIFWVYFNIRNFLGAAVKPQLSSETAPCQTQSDGHRHRRANGRVTLGWMDWVLPSGTRAACLHGARSLCPDQTEIRWEFKRGNRETKPFLSFRNTKSYIRLICLHTYTMSNMTVCNNPHCLPGLRWDITQSDLPLPWPLVTQIYSMSYTEDATELISFSPPWLKIVHASNSAVNNQVLDISEYMREVGMCSVWGHTCAFCTPHLHTAGIPVPVQWITAGEFTLFRGYFWAFCLGQQHYERQTNVRKERVVFIWFMN